MNISLDQSPMAQAAASLRAYQAKRRARPPSAEKGPAAGQANGAMKRADDGIDFPMVMALRALLFPAARARAASNSQDLFPDGAPRILARALISDTPPNLSGLNTRQRRELEVLIGAVERATVPDSDEWAVRCIDLQAENQHLPLLIDALGWAQDRVRDRWPLKRIERDVVHAFRIAGGDLPLDPAHGWECAA